MRKIINQPEDIVAEMGRGIALTYPGLVFDPKFHYIMAMLTGIGADACFDEIVKTLGLEPRK